MTVQKFSSARTDINQVPAIFKLLMDNLERPRHFFADTNEILDYGGGAGEKLTKKWAELRVRNLVLDPYNRSEEHNAFVRQLLTIKPADHAICSNVLNVIKEPEVRMEVLREIAALTSHVGCVFFTVYEGNKSSRGRQTKKDCWQANRPFNSYVKEIRKVFQTGTYFANCKVLMCEGRREPNTKRGSA